MCKVRLEGRVAILEAIVRVNPPMRISSKHGTCTIRNRLCSYQEKTPVPRRVSLFGWTQHLLDSLKKKELFMVQLF